jgi:hypothetical protein
MKIITFARLIVLLMSAVLCSCVNSSTEDIYMSDGLVAYYPLNGNSNNMVDRDHDGVLKDATPVADRFGNANSALSFNGVTSFIRCGDILDDIFCAPVARFSVSGWAKTITMGTFARGGGLILGKNGGGTNGPFQWNVNHSDGVVYAAVMSDPTAKNYIALTSPMPANQWFHFVLVFDGSLAEANRLQLYVNGESINTTIYQHVGTLGPTTTNTTQELTIGSGHVGGAPQTPNNLYNGYLDDIRIYNRALTFAEQHDLYVAKK